MPLFHGNIPLKTSQEISIMREGGKILAEILETLKNEVKAGITTEYLNDLAETLIEKFNVKPSFKNYRGYPAVICASVNDEVVHSIPNDKELKEGDIISIDCGILYKFFHVDATVLTYIPPILPEIKKFLETTESALKKAISVARPGNKVGDISFAIEETVKKNGYSPVHELTGHGIGKSLHEPPQIENYGKKNTGEALVPGMTIAIEPIINMGQLYIKTLNDGWTIVTKDGLPSAQIEHTIAITQEGSKILTII